MLLEAERHIHTLCLSLGLLWTCLGLNTFLICVAHISFDDLSHCEGTRETERLSFGISTTVYILPYNVK